MADVSPKRAINALALSTSLIFFSSYAFSQDFSSAEIAYKNNDFQLAIEILKPLVNNADARSQNLLGDMYFYGQGVERDFGEAFRLKELAASQGIIDAINFVAGGYYWGEIVEKDLQKAAEFYKLAARRGDISSAYSLGQMYEDGIGVEKSIEDAVFWYLVSAEGGMWKPEQDVIRIYNSGEFDVDGYVSKKLANQDDKLSKLAVNYYYDELLLSIANQAAEAMKAENVQLSPEEVVNSANKILRRLGVSADLTVCTFSGDPRNSVNLCNFNSGYVTFNQVYTAGLVCIYDYGGNLLGARNFTNSQYPDDFWIQLCPQ